MTKLPTFKPKEVEKILLKHGFYIKRQSGSHRIYHNLKSDSIVVIPFHSRDIAKGTLKNIIKQSKLTIEEFTK